MKLTTILVVFTYCRRVQASYGDMDADFVDCIGHCEETNCSSPDAPSRFLGFPYWTCDDDCKYDCMQAITTKRAQMGLEPFKYYGHWPFIRLFGLEEPASVLFSLLNGVPYLWNLGLCCVEYIGTAGTTAISSSSSPSNSSSDNDKRRRHYMRPWLLLYYLIGINTWICSAHFHARKTPVASLVDYIGALMFLAYSLWIAFRRIWGWNASPTYVGLVFTLCVALYGLQVHRMVRGEVPFHQHMSLCIGISVAIVATWSVWIFFPINTDTSASICSSNGNKSTSKSNNSNNSNKCGSHSSNLSSNSNSHRNNYRYLCLLCQVWFSLAALLEIFDFPAQWGHFDAHSLWHLATIPLGFIWGHFFRLDTASDGCSVKDHGDSTSSINADNRTTETKKELELTGDTKLPVQIAIVAAVAKNKGERKRIHR